MTAAWRYLCGVLVAFCCLVGSASAAPGLWQLRDEFTDEFGTKATLSHWAGAQTVVSMEYSACKFVCSTNWRRLLEIQAEADKQKIAVRFLIVSLDPVNDNPAAWRDYRKVRGLTRNNWTFVTGNRKATDNVVAALGVKWWIFNDSIMHDFRVLRLSETGTRLALMDNFEQSPAAFLSN
ncbi:MAG: SCO family protein [Burkholderiales bacterium]|nr:SCO family protein [Burkholderiales bacterium]